MLELAIWMYHIGNPDPVVRAITDVATGLVILWGVVNHYAKNLTRSSWTFTTRCETGKRWRTTMQSRRKSCEKG